MDSRKILDLKVEEPPRKTLRQWGKENEQARDRVRRRTQERNTLESWTKPEPWSVWSWAGWGLFIVMILALIWFSGYHAGRTDTRALGPYPAVEQEQTP